MTFPRCIDCEHYQMSKPFPCAAPENREIDYVNGGLRPRYMMAQTARESSLGCTPDAKWFRAKVRRPGEAFFQ